MHDSNLIVYPSARHGINPTAMPTKAAQAASSASADFVRIAWWFITVRGNANQYQTSVQSTPHSSAPLPRSMFRPRGVVSDYEYIVLPKQDFSRQKTRPHIHPASKIRNQA